jgi:Ca-activated chloride channel family protein
MKRGSSRGLWLVALLLLGGWDLFKSPNANVERGNQAFRDGKYDEALEAYDKAATQLPNDPGVKFNQGVARYQKALNTPPGPARDQLLQQAQGDFEGATQAPDRSLRGQAHYNLGNTHYQRQDWDKAVKEYKQSIKEDPSNPDARYNLELALRKREQKKQQQQQQQQQQGQGQQQKQQQQGQQGQQDQQQQGQQDQQQQGQQQQDQQQQGQQQDQQQQGQQQQQDQQQQGQQQQGQQDQQQKPSPQDQQQQGQQDQQQQPSPQDQQQQQNGQDQQGSQDQQKPQDPAQDQQNGQDPKGQQDQQNPKDPKDSKDQPGQPHKPKDDQRKTYGDAENKMDALERRSKDLKVQQQRGRGERRRGKVKDW